MVEIDFRIDPNWHYVFDFDVKRLDSKMQPHWMHKHSLTSNIDENVISWNWKLILGLRLGNELLMVFFCFQCAVTQNGFVRNE